MCQYLNLTAPIYQAVYQRNASDNGNIPIAGQIVTSGTSYTVVCITRKLDENGNFIAGQAAVSTTITSNAPKGIFNGSVYRPIGWYSVEVKVTVNNTGYSFSTNSKCGIGDVFIIAGQSNGQGYNNIIYPSTTNFPEWIVGNNEEWNCRREYEQIPAMSKITGSNLISPAGNNSWCYGVLGKKISDANGGMPVAFFNTGAAGSSVKNWFDGSNNATTNGFYNNQQWCGAFQVNGEVQSTDYYTGQPYLTLKNTLNWYVSLFGVRAILWHQGEQDAQNKTTDPGEAYLTRNATDYGNYLANVINKSRIHSGEDISWIIAKVSHYQDNISGDNSDNDNSSLLDAKAQAVRNGQQNAINGGTTPSQSNIFQGPLTDRFNSDSNSDNSNPSTTNNSGTSSLRRSDDDTHFDESRGINNHYGLTTLGELWYSKIASSITNFTRILPKSIPSISVTQSGSDYILSVQSGATNYCWTRGVVTAPPAPPIPPSTTLSGCLNTTNTLTVSSGSGDYRCYINTGVAPAIIWRTSPRVLAQVVCTSCREGVEESDDSYGGINMKIYPNPSDKDFRIEFDVPEDDTHVKLEFFDMAGNSVKVIADGSHAKGHFVYPITETLPTGASICQLKVGEIFVSKKMIRVN
jgi:hypothetical protein